MASRSRSPPLKPNPSPPASLERSIVTVRAPAAPTATEVFGKVRIVTADCAIAQSKDRKHTRRFVPGCELRAPVERRGDLSPENPKLEAALPPSHLFRPMEQFNLSRFFFGALLEPVLVRCTDEGLEQRVRLKRLRLEFWVELATDEVWMRGDLDH